MVLLGAAETGSLEVSKLVTVPCCDMTAVELVIMSAEETILKDYATFWAMNSLTGPLMVVLAAVPHVVLATTPPEDMPINFEQ